MNHTNNRRLTGNAQSLRKEMTKEERHLWYDFLKDFPYTVNRQKVIGHYIVDFYCHQAKLVVELDGSQHCDPGNIEYDHRRTAYLESQGLQVVRFSNLDINHRFRDVCEMIYHILEVRTAHKP